MLSLLSPIQHLPLFLFEIFFDCSEIFLDFLEDLVYDFVNFFNKYIIVRQKISPSKKFKKFSLIPVYHVFL